MDSHLAGYPCTLATLLIETLNTYKFITYKLNTTKIQIVCIRLLTIVTTQKKKKLALD